MWDICFLVKLLVLLTILYACIYMYMNIYKYLTCSFIGWQCGLLIAVTLFFLSGLFSHYFRREIGTLVHTVTKQTYFFPFEHATGIPKTECSMQNK